MSINAARFPYFVLVGPQATGKTCYCKGRKHNGISFLPPPVTIPRGRTIKTLAQLKLFFEGNIGDLTESLEIINSPPGAVCNPVASSVPTVYAPVNYAEELGDQHLLVDLPGSFLLLPPDSSDQASLVNQVSENVRLAQRLLDQASIVLLFVPWFTLLWTSLDPEMFGPNESLTSRALRNLLDLDGKPIWSSEDEFYTDTGLRPRIDRMNEVFSGRGWDISSWSELLGPALAREKLGLFLTSFERFYQLQAILTIVGANHQLRGTFIKGENKVNINIHECGTIPADAIRQLVTWQYIDNDLGPNGEGWVNPDTLKRLTLSIRKSDQWKPVFHCLNNNNAAVINVLSEEAMLPTGGRSDRSQAAPEFSTDLRKPSEDSSSPPPDRPGVERDASKAEVPEDGAAASRDPVGKAPVL